MSTAHSEPSKISRRVLLVDDRRDAIFPLQMLLKLMKHEVTSASSGAQAIELADEFLPDTVLCDISLGMGLSGYDVARALRANPKHQGIYLVAISGYDDQEDRIEARDAGFDFHVTKPVSKDQLDRLMQERPKFGAAV